MVPNVSPNVGPTHIGQAVSAEVAQFNQRTPNPAPRMLWRPHKEALPAVGNNGRMPPRARYLVSNPCEDACGTITTDRTLEGAPVYRCPGCDSEWIELAERTEPADEPKPASTPEET